MNNDNINLEVRHLTMIIIIFLSLTCYIKKQDILRGKTAKKEKWVGKSNIVLLSNMKLLHGRKVL